LLLTKIEMVLHMSFIGQLESGRSLIPFEWNWIHIG
jgi:hypothetical protein